MTLQVPETCPDCNSKDVEYYLAGGVKCLACGYDKEGRQATPEPPPMNRAQRRKQR